MNKHVLIVEDDLDDQDLLEEAMSRANPSVQLKFMENGLSALEYLNSLKDTRQPLPQLIILDLNMPYINGLQTYKKLQADAVLNNIPIVVFTSSQNPNDRELFERMGVLFLTKPYNFTNMNEIVQRMLLYADDQTVR